jgi:hypothetical protein
VRAGVGGGLVALTAVFAQPAVRAHGRAIAVLAAPLHPVVRAAAALFAVVLSLEVRAPAPRSRVAVAALLALLAMRAPRALVALRRHFAVPALRSKLERRPAVLGQRPRLAWHRVRQPRHRMLVHLGLPFLHVNRAVLAPAPTKRQPSANQAPSSGRRVLTFLAALSCKSLAASLPTASASASCTLCACSSERGASASESGGTSCGSPYTGATASTPGSPYPAWSPSSPLSFPILIVPLTPACPGVLSLVTVPLRP